MTPGTEVRRVAILGSTGSIGQAALRVLARHPDLFRVTALTANERADLLRLQVDTLPVAPSFVGLAGPGADGDPGWHTGAGALVAAATRDDVDIVLNGVVGAAGLEATLAALRRGRRVALANKESLVVAGRFVLAAAAEGGGEIVPVDSEHSAILQCLAGRECGAVSRLILTASGGPFRGWSADRIAAATVDEALKHPTWRMGRKITVDSATLANKALEVIEAHHLFGVPYDRISVLVHPQSVVHSLVEFVDGSTVAQLGVPSMELPILYALTHPERVTDGAIPRLDLTAGGALTFEEVDAAAFPALSLGVAAGRQGGAAPAVYNAANETAVALFLEGSIRFGDIAGAIGAALDALGSATGETLDDVVQADRGARRLVREMFRC